MTPDKATALREAAERATLGPWRVQGVGPAVLAITNYLAGTGEHVVAEDAIAFIDRAANAAYIALADPPTILALLAERERLRAFALAYRRKMEVGIAGMTDEEIQTLRLAWDYASAALEATDDQ